MTGTSFVWRGLWHFRRSYLGVLAGSALGAMVLLGALMVGDSVKATLRQLAAARLGQVDAVLAGGDRLFRSALADDLVAEKAAPVLMVKATATVQASGRALANVQVLGVDRRFWQLRPDAPDAAADDGDGGPQDREFFVNDFLARSLDLGLDQTLVLRFEKPGMIARDAPLADQAAELVDDARRCERDLRRRGFRPFQPGNHASCRKPPCLCQSSGCSTRSASPARPTCCCCTSARATATPTCCKP